MVTSLRAVAWLAAIVLGGSSVPGAERTPVVWPAAPRPHLAVVTRSAVFDEVPVTTTELVGPEVRLGFDPSALWVHGGRPPPGLSTLLTHYQNADVRLGFACFGPGEFLPGLSRRDWEDYLAGLRLQHGPLLLGLEEAGTVEGGDGMFVFGRPYREVAYSFRAGPASTERVRREVFVVLPRGLLAIVLEGPSEVTPLFAAAFQGFLARLELLE